MPGQTEQVLFEEEQSFRQPWLWILMSGVLVVIAVSLGIVAFQPIDQAGVLQVVVTLSLVMVVEVAAVVLMYVLKLTVRVDAEGLHVRFFPMAKRDIALAEIARWEARTYHPIWEYGGWGIRYGWKGMAYNVSGNRGVQLVFGNGKRLLIGSQHPEELAAAIDQAKQQSP